MMVENQDFSFESANIIPVSVNKNAFKGYLYEIYADLIARYSFALDLRTFQSYMCLPMLISEKIFRTLDSACKNRITREQFVEGLHDLYVGDPIKRIDLVFDILDFDKDGIIGKQDTWVLLSQFHLINGSQGLQMLEEIINDSFAENSFMQKDQFLLSSDIYFLFISFLNAYKPFKVSSVNYYQNLNCINRSFFTSSDNCLYVPTKEVKKSSFYSSQMNSNIFKVTQESVIADPSNKVKFFLKGKLNRTLSSVTGSEEKDDSLAKELEILDKFEFDKENALLIEDCEILGAIPPYASHKLLAKSSNMFSNGKISAACQSNSKSQVTTTDCVESHGPINNSGQKNINQLQDSSVLGNNRSRKSSCTSETYPRIMCDQELETLCEIIVYMKDSKDVTQSSRNKFILINDDIFWFKNSMNNWIFQKILHIRASFFDKCEPIVIEDKAYFPFQICIDFSSNSCPPIDVFCEDQNEMIDFVSRCKAATKIRRISNVYDLKEDIGKGQYANVKLGINRLTNHKVAVKILNKHEVKKENIQMVMSEMDIFRILMNISHNHIVKAIDYFETSSMVYFVYEYLPEGNLTKYLSTKSKSFKSDELVELLFQIGNAITYLHYLGILHRDIKPDNILVDLKLDNSIQLKLIDFGLSKVMALSDKTHESYGSLCYTAPEILLNQPYNHKVDVWSFGVLGYYLNFTVLPFDDSSNKLKAIRDKIVKGKEDYGIPLKYSCKFEMEIKKMISSCLIKDPQKRISMKDFMKLNLRVKIMSNPQCKKAW